MYDRKEKIPVAMRMDPDLHKELKIFAIQKGITLQDCVDKAIKQFIKRNTHEKTIIQ